MEKTVENITGGIVSSRNITLDIFKGILIVLVFIRHMLQYSVEDEGGIITNFIWAVQMPGFMLISGYFSARKIKDIRTIGKRILLSVQHYALPFFSWALLIGCLICGESKRNPIAKFTVLMNHVDWGLWFLWTLFVLSVIATLANYALCSRKAKIAKLALCLLGCFGVLLVIGKWGGVLTLSA